MKIEWIYLIAGVILLFYGKKMIWLLLACVGFSAGFSFVSSTFPSAPVWLPYAVGLGAGVLLVVLIKTVKNLAFGLGGFLLGAYVVSNLLVLLHFHPGGWEVVLYLLGGLIFAGLLLTLFDQALIFASSALGSMLIVQNLPQSIIPEEILFFILLGAGVVGQILLSRRKKRKSIAV